MVWESILLVFLLALGALQIAASWAGFKGISFFRHRIMGYIFGFGLVIGAFTWFFVAVKVGEGGPKGQHDDQSVSTILGGGAALLLTWMLPSIMRYRSMRDETVDDDPEGIEVFKQKTFMQAVCNKSSENRKDI